MTQKDDQARKAERFAELTDRLLAGEAIDPAEVGDLAPLLKTMSKLNANAQAEPSPGLATRIRNLAMADLPGPKATISERLQEVIKRLIGDEDFRTNFFTAPESTLQQAGFQLTPAEIAALKEMEPENLENWMSDLDERISKSGLL
jgi:hypothetical protein